MSSINQILNSALMETVETETLEEGRFKMPVKSASEKAILAGSLGAAGLGVGGAIANETEGGPGSVKSQIPPTTPATPTESPAASKVTSWADKIMTGAKDVYAAHPDKVKYAGAGAVALGAGLGAMALARKLRNKKKAVKKA